MHFYIYHSINGNSIPGWRTENSLLKCNGYCCSTFNVSNLRYSAMGLVKNYSNLPTHPKPEMTVREDLRITQQNMD